MMPVSLNFFGAFQEIFEQPWITGAISHVYLLRLTHELYRRTQ